MRSITAIPILFFFLTTILSAAESLHPRIQERIELIPLTKVVRLDYRSINRQLDGLQNFSSNSGATFYYVAPERPQTAAMGFELSYSNGNSRYSTYAAFSSNLYGGIGIQYNEVTAGNPVRTGEAVPSLWQVGAEYAWCGLQYDHFYLYPFGGFALNGTSLTFTEGMQQQQIGQILLQGVFGLALDVRLLPVYLSTTSFFDIGIGMRLDYTQPILPLYTFEDGSELLPVSTRDIRLGINGANIQLRLLTAYNF